jgi:hypothetical protein
MTPASGINPNPFFATAEIKTPIIKDSSKIDPLNLKPTLLYDLPTQAGGTYTITGITGVKRSDSPIPQSYSLEQNYPNPFNPLTKIIYFVPKKSHITLKVYNLLGQEVASLFEGIQQAGNYTATFDGSGLSSGLYLYRMTAENFTDAKKAVLLK